MHPLTFATAAMIVATALMIALAGDALAHAPATDPIRPKPRPLMDCWVDENGQIDGCRVVRK